MDESIRQRVFEPFFTTKEMGRGTGLGLASVYGIIKNHRGIVTVVSQKGEGTTFHIYLPASDLQVSRDASLVSVPPKGRETILLVDDEQMIIDIGRDMLESLGYHVLTADTGEEALGIFEKSRDDIDLVVLDMVMPKMGGGEVFDRLIEIRPDVKVLLASGYTIRGQATEILNRGCDGFIQKPFNLEQLSEKTREILDTKKEAVRRAAQSAL
jgi:CheY-like chemotaxis protein